MTRKKPNLYDPHMAEPAKPPKARAKTVRLWHRFAEAIEEVWGVRDEAVDVVTVGEVINDAPALALVIRTRAAYLKALVEDGLLKADQSVPDDNFLWEMWPSNIPAEYDF